jgi:hypothetical protein
MSGETERNPIQLEIIALQSNARDPCSRTREVGSKHRIYRSIILIGFVGDAAPPVARLERPAGRSRSIRPFMRRA